MNTIKDYCLLTIIIPTYNRREQVEQNLRNILPQVLSFKNQVRIYISDNASMDGTEDMMMKYIEEYPGIIFYYRQSQNITASPNFNHAVHAVNSDYVYILGDDDLSFPNSIQTMLMFIDKYPQVSLFHFNYVLGDQKMVNFKMQYNRWEYGVGVETFSTGAEFIKKFFNGPSFISSNLFKTEAWEKGDIVDMSKYPGYGWLMHLYWGVISSPCIFISIPIVAQRTGARGYSKNWSFYAIVSMSRIFEDLDIVLPGFYAEWDRYRTVQRYDLLLEIADVCYDRKRYKRERKLLEQYLPNRFFKIMLFINLYFLPRLIINKMEYCLIIIAKRTDEMIRKFRSL